MMIPRVLVTAISVAALAAAQGPPAAQSGCTSNSFAIPSWMLTEIKTSDADTSISFALQNRAINYTADTICSIARKGWNTCSVTTRAGSLSDTDIEVRGAVEGTLARFSVNQTWSCNDRNTTLKFTAAGTSQVFLSEKPLSVSPLLVRGALTSPVAINPIYAIGPTGHDSPKCTALSEKPSWTISGLYYFDRPGDGIDVAPSRQINLLLTNDANGYEASCMQGASFAPGAGTANTIVCAGYEFQSSGGGRYTISTTATFDPDTKNFTFTQTWFCDDTNPRTPLQITATASEILPLKCTTSETTHETICAEHPPHTLTGKLGTVTTLQPYALEDPVLPRADGCTITSLLRPSWAFSAFTVFSDDSAGAEWSSLLFQLILNTPSRGFQFPIEVFVSRGAAAGGGGGGDEASWYDCEIGADGGNDRPLWPYKCQVKYVARTKELTLKADWACGELDPEHPVNFSGISVSTVKSDLSCEKDDESYSCFTVDTGYSWTAPISDVTWRSVA